MGATTPGAYSLVVRALDAAGNELLRSSARSFVLGSAPFVDVSEPLTGLEYAAPAVINVKGRATTSTAEPAFPGLDRVEVYLGATLVSSNARVGASNDFSATLTDVPVGVHDIRVRAYALDGSHTDEIRRVRVLAADDDDRLRIASPVEGEQIQGPRDVYFKVGGVAGRWDQLAEVNVLGTGTGGWHFDGSIIPGGLRDWMSVDLTRVGPWSVWATAKTQQGGMRYSQKVGFNFYNRSIAIWDSSSLELELTHIGGRVLV